MEDDIFFVTFWEKKDNLNLKVAERVPKCFGEWKTTTIFYLMEDHLGS
jgi:hypothetical protein